MNNQILNEINSIIQYVEKNTDEKISEDYAFNLFLLQYFFFNGLDIEKCYADIEDLVTDGTNDGGIDFVFYDEENDRIVLGQSKYRGKLPPADIVNELDKMSNTVACFLEGNTGSFNDRVKKQVQNALDRLSDEDAGNVEYCIFTTATLDLAAAQKKIANQHGNYSSDMISLYQEDDIVERINEVLAQIDLVQYESVDIDQANNYLSYETNKAEGIIVNLSSKSLISLFNRFADKGLFDLNIRKYIGNKTVDNGIKRTLEKDRDSFWFLNNGIIIACKDFEVDGYTVKISDFSIVNGGQTTNIIGKYKGKNTQEFYIPCKIIRDKTNSESAQFFNRIAEATNSQKPILPRDLKSNSPEMRTLKQWLGKQNIELEIKRGDKAALKNPTSKIKNDELGQFIMSFVLQRPGTSRSGKKRIFDNNDLYNQVFRVNYISEEDKSEFLVSSIDLIDRVSRIIAELKKSKKLTELNKEILKNGTQVIYALLGIIYRLANKDVTKEDLLNDPSIIKTKGLFNYRKVLDYSKDELDQNLEIIINVIIRAVTEKYSRDAKDESLEITSVSNYFKTDKKYYDLIIPGFVEYLDYTPGQELISKYYIFKAE